MSKPIIFLFSVVSLTSLCEQRVHSNVSLCVRVRVRVCVCE